MDALSLRKFTGEGERERQQIYESVLMRTILLLRPRRVYPFAVRKSERFRHSRRFRPRFSRRTRAREDDARRVLAENTKVTAAERARGPLKGVWFIGVKLAAIILTRIPPWRARELCIDPSIPSYLVARALRTYGELRTCLWLSYLRPRRLASIPHVNCVVSG